MKQLSKLNNVLKKYQPLIQTLGIVLIVGGLVFTWIQISLTRRELALNEEARNYQNSPSWIANFKKDDSNALIDKLYITSTNSLYNIQKIRIIVLDGILDYEFENVGADISTNALKAHLARVYRDHYSVQYLICPGCVESDSYPLALTIFFERLGARRDTTILFNYHFKTYFTKKSIRLKSEGLEFVKYIQSDSASLTRELIHFNLSSSFLSSISNAGFEIRKAIAFRDPVLKPLMEFAYANVKKHQASFQIPVDKTEGIGGEVIIQVPLIFRDSVALKERNLIVDEIIENMDGYDETLRTAISNIEKFETSFDEASGTTHLDSLRKHQSVIVNFAQWEEWAKLNSQLVNLVTKRVKI